MYYQQRNRFWKKHGTKCIFGGLTVLGLVVSRGDIIRGFADNAQVSADVRERNERVSRLERDRRQEEKEAAIAEKRYEGCIPIVGEELRNGRHYFVGLQEDQIVTDRITGRPLARRTIVCDANGTTAVVGEGGKLESIAFTGNRQLVTQRTAHFQRQQFSLPVAK